MAVAFVLDTGPGSVSGCRAATGRYGPGGTGMWMRMNDMTPVRGHAPAPASRLAAPNEDLR